VDVEDDAQQVRYLVERVQRQRLPVRVVEQRLEAGEALAVVVGLRVRRRRRGVLRARVGLRRAVAVVERLEQLAQVLARGRRVVRQRAQLGDVGLRVLE